MQRVVITGIGLVTPNGIGTEETWKSLLAAESGIGPITLFDASQFTTRIAGEVKGFQPEAWIPKKKIKEMARFAQLHKRVAHPYFGLTLDIGHLHCIGDFPITDHLRRWREQRLLVRGDQR